MTAPITDFATIAQLRDLESAWQDVHARLSAILEMAGALWKESEWTWLDMVIVRQHAHNARLALGPLPPTLLRAIAPDHTAGEQPARKGPHA